MKEQFDVDLSRALKHGTAKELQGWEFTPAMQRNVMERIRAQEAGTAAPAGRRTARIPRPLMWATVAAAAFLLALNLDLRGFGGSRQESAKSAAPQAASFSTAGHPGAAKEAPAPPGSPAGAEAKPAPQREAASRSMAAQEATKLELLPPARKIRLEPPVSAGAATTLTAPNNKAVMTATPQVYRAAAAGPATILLSATGLTAVGVDGSAAWQRPLAGVTDQSALAVDADGRAAVSVDRKVHVVGRDGALEPSFELPGRATGLAWSPDGRLAAAHGSAVGVYRDGALQFATPASPGAYMAFGPGSSLAVLDSGALTVFDPDGRPLANLTGRSGQSLAFPDEQTVLTAGGAYSRTLEKRWAMPLQARGIAVAGGGLVVAWSADQVMGLRPQDGAVLWQANVGGAAIELVAVDPAGTLVAVASATDLWVFRPAGEVKLTEPLAAGPSGMTFSGPRLVLLLPDGPSYREIAQ